MNVCSAEEYRRDKIEGLGNYSAKKRLFVSQNAVVDFDDDLRPLSSDESCVSENYDDNIKDFCLSPSIHKGIENLAVNKNILIKPRESMEQSTPYSQRNLESTSIDQEILTPWNNSTFLNTDQETPELSIMNESVNAPSKNASLADIKISFEDEEEANTGITPSLFYGGSIPAVAYVKYSRLSRSEVSKVKTKLFEDKKKGRVSKRYKRPVSIFSGVGHGIRKRKVMKVVKPERKLNIRDKIRKEFKFRNTRSNVKWNYDFSSVSKRNGSYYGNRKFFKSIDQSEQMKRKYSNEYDDDDNNNPNKKIRKEHSDVADPTHTSDVLNNKSWSVDFDGVEPLITKHTADSSSHFNKVSYLLHENCEGQNLEKKQHNSLAGKLNEHELYKGIQRNDDCLNLQKNGNAKGILSDNRLSSASTKVKMYPIFNTKEQNKLISPVLKEVTNKGYRNKLKKAAFDENQYILDAGQKKFGSTQCRQCEMIYQISNPADEERHTKYHNSSNVLKYKAWKKENIVGYRNLDRIILVTSADPKGRIQKVKDILKHTEDEIGSYTFSFSNVWKAFLYIRDNLICGCLIAESKKCAYRVAKENDILLHAEEPQNVKCGINRIWTNPANRREKIATELMNCLRKNFISNQFLTIDDIAFSATTLEGHAFAKKYIGKDYLIYT